MVGAKLGPGDGATVGFTWSQMAPEKPEAQTQPNSGVGSLLLPSPLPPPLLPAPLLLSLSPSLSLPSWISRLTHVAPLRHGETRHGS